MPQPNLTLISSQSTTEISQQQQQKAKPTIKPTAKELADALLELLAADGITQIERVKIDVAPVVSSLLLADPVTGENKPIVTGKTAALLLTFHPSKEPRDSHKYKMAVDRLRRYGVEGHEQQRA